MSPSLCNSSGGIGKTAASALEAITEAVEPPALGGRPAACRRGSQQCRLVGCWPLQAGVALPAQQWHGFVAGNGTSLPLLAALLASDPLTPCGVIPQRRAMAAGVPCINHFVGTPHTVANQSPAFARRRAL